VLTISLGTMTPERDNRRQSSYGKRKSYLSLFHFLC
jgi:hypothetical protein